MGGCVVSMVSRTKRKAQTDDALPDCPKCGASAQYGRCSIRSCGWRSDARLIRDSFRHHTRIPTQLVLDIPLLTREVLSESGKVLHQEWRCPECKGKGWSTNANESCRLCHGYGVITKTVLALYLDKKVGL